MSRLSVCVHTRTQRRPFCLQCEPCSRQTQSPPLDSHPGSAPWETPPPSPPSGRHLSRPQPSAHIKHTHTGTVSPVSVWSSVIEAIRMPHSQNFKHFAQNCIYGIISSVKLRHFTSLFTQFVFSHETHNLGYQVSWNNIKITILLCILLILINMLILIKCIICLKKIEDQIEVS